MCWDRHLHQDTPLVLTEIIEPSFGGILQSQILACHRTQRQQAFLAPNSMVPGPCCCNKAQSLVLYKRKAMDGLKNDCEQKKLAC